MKLVAKCSKLNFFVWTHLRPIIVNIWTLIRLYTGLLVKFIFGNISTSLFLLLFSEFNIIELTTSIRISKIIISLRLCSPITFPSVLSFLLTFRMLHVFLSIFIILLNIFGIAVNIVLVEIIR